MSHNHNCDVCQEDYVCDEEDNKCKIEESDETICPECADMQDFPEDYSSENEPYDE